MENRNWRDIVEIVGIVSIVVGLILVAWEVRQANSIATTQVVMDLASQANEFNSSAFANSDVADLLSVISDPDGADISATQESMIASVAQHFANIFWAAQRAYDNGVLSDDDIFLYQSSLAWHLENLPGLRPAYLTLYDNTPWLRTMYVFEPLVELACGSATPCGDRAADN